MNKQRFFSILFVVLIVVVIAAIVFMFFWLRSESASCLSDPMGYVAQVSNNTCYCLESFAG